ncbi:MAG: polysaccharide biosynthesis tyrosine autokinase [Planctomycetes bacterium]|nr:polysaccharide biosynthesis tyrosine autokinase [Planctomycetota bacterium]
MLDTDMFRSRKNQQAEPAPALPDDVVVIVDRAVNPYLVLFHEPAGFMAEQVRGLRNRLLAMNPDGEPKTLVVASAVRGEGRTVTALNLAMAFSELDRNETCIIDADLRRPLCEQYLNLNPQVGISDVLLGTVSIDKALRDVGQRNLKLLSAGTQTASPADVLGTSRIDELFARLKERFQYVVIDTPPVLSCTDAGVLAARADGALVVLRLEHSLKGQSREAVRSLQNLGTNVLGSFVCELRGQDPGSNPRLSYGESEA